MDERRRRFDRRFAETGGTEDMARVLQERVRAGELVWDRVNIAAHLQHPVALAMVGGDGRLKVVCQTCTKETPDFPKGQCDRCRGQIVYAAPTDLIRFTQNPDAALPIRLLVQWAVDCAEHAKALCSSPTARAAIDHYLATGQRLPALNRARGRPMPHPPTRWGDRHLTAQERHQRLLACVWPNIIHGLTAATEQTAREQISLSVSMSYRGKGSLATERDYQRSRLTELLLDHDVPWS